MNYTDESRAASMRNHVNETERIAAMRSDGKITVELDGAILKFHLPADVRKLITDALGEHNDIKEEMGETADGLDRFVSTLFLKGGLTHERPFREWLKERLKEVAFHDAGSLEDHLEERARYCSECDELLENCLCYEDN